MVKKVWQEYTRQYIAVLNLVGNLKGASPLRQVITRQSHLNLTELAVVHPNETRQLFKRLRALNLLAQTPSKIIVPQALTAPQNMEVYRDLSKDISLLHKVMNSKMELDLRKAGLRTNSQVKDIAEDFAAVAICNKLRATYTGKNLEAVINDREVGDFTLFNAVFRVRMLLYIAQEKKAAAKKEGDEIAYCEAHASLMIANKFLKDLTDDKNGFPFGEESYRTEMKQGIKDIINWISGGYVPTAHAKLVKLSRKMERICKKGEEERLKEEQKSRLERPKTIFEENLLRLARRRYRIKIGDDYWSIPQAGFRTHGAVAKKEDVPHEVEKKKILRATDHQIERITKEIGLNSHHSAALNSLKDNIAGILKINLEKSKKGKTDRAEIDLEQTANLAADACAAYERAKAPQKVKAHVILEMLLDLLVSAKEIKNGEALDRIFGFVQFFAEIAQRELDLRNEVLVSQLRRLSVKKKIEQEIIEYLLRRDLEVRSIAEMIRNGLRSKKVVWLPWRLLQLYYSAVEAGNIIAQREEKSGESKLGKNFSDLAKWLAKLRRLVIEKNQLKDRYAAWRTNYGIYQKDLKEKGRVVIEGEGISIKELRELSLKNASKIIAGLTQHNKSIKDTILIALKLIYKVIHILNSCILEETPAEEDLFEFRRFEEKIKERSHDNVVVLTKSNPPIELGRIFRGDAEGMELRRMEVADWEEYLKKKA